MKIFDFSNVVGHPITLFDSQKLTQSRILRHANELRISCMHLEPNGVIGFHEATIDQLFLVVQGEGWVRGEEKKRTFIKAGAAAFWVAGEWHESGSDTGMMAIVIEGNNLKPEKQMPTLS